MLAHLSLVDCLLIAAAVAGGLYVLIPPLMFALGLTRVRVEVQLRPEEAHPLGDDPDYAKRYQEFAALGFMPVGTTVEHVWFMNPLKWYRKSRQPLRWMTSREGPFLASFHRLIADEPVRFSVATLTSDGGKVRTTCPGAGGSRLDGNSLTVVMKNVTPAELLASHARQLEEFCRQRHVQARASTLAEMAAAEEGNTKRVLYKLWSGHKYLLFLVYFAAPALLASRLGARLGMPPGDWRTWAAATLAGVAVFAFFKNVTLARLFKQSCHRTHSALPQPALR